MILCVNNLSRFPQPVELDLRRFEGMVPTELLGGVPFPADRRAALPAHPVRLRLLLVPAHRVRGPPRRDSCCDQHRSTRLDPSVFEDYLARTRWFGGKGRPFDGHRRPDRSAIARRTAPQVVIHLVELTLRRRRRRAERRELYQVPLALLRAPGAPGSTTPSSAGGRTPSTAGCTPTTRCTTARRWRSGSGPSTLRAPRRRPRGAGWCSTGCPVTTSTSRRTRRCSPASSPTPRSPSARTR